MPKSESMTAIDTVAKVVDREPGDEAPENLPAAPRQDERGVARREELGAVTNTMTAETASSAVAAQAAATVQARYAMAIRQPRDVDAFRQDLLRDCLRKGFARVAEYAKPVGGGKVKGPSIRFVENALRRFRNVDVATPVIFDSQQTRIARVVVTDLEGNLTQQKDVTIEKTVERSQPRPTPELPLGYLSVRKNTSGGNTYLVIATDDEILNKENALISKAMRNCGLRILPGDIVEEAMEVCKQTREKEDAKDPDAARRTLIDAFAKLNVSVSDLKAFMGTDLDKLSPAQVDDLRSVWNALKEGEIKWSDLAEAKAKNDEAGASSAGKSKADQLASRLAGGRAANA